MSLKEFVLGACAQRVGLEVPAIIRPQTRLIPIPKPPASTGQEQADQLIAFVAALPAARNSADPAKAKAAERGLASFKTIGCGLPRRTSAPPRNLWRPAAARHGPGLADAVSQFRQAALLRKEGEIDTYINAGPALKILQQEWRTPPPGACGTTAPSTTAGPKR
jgi:hypothetical protein